MRATEIRTADAMRSHTQSPSGWQIRRFLARSLATIVLIGACGGSLVSAADQSARRSDFPVAAGDDEIPPWPEDVGVDSRPLVPSRNAPRAVA